METPHAIDRREALRRVALILGGAVSAPTLAGVLAGCEAPRSGGTAAAAAPWTPKALSAPQGELVATIADHILPATDTPGARDAGVHQFIDAMLADHYPAADKARFLAGLEGIDVRARGRHKKAFAELTSEEQVAILTEMDRAAYPAKGAAAKADKAQQPPPRDAIVGPSPGTGTGALAQQTYGDAAAEVAEPVRNELKSEWFWKRMKELTLTGYYTSQVGATQELKVNPMGAWRGDVAYPSLGRSWA
jgi:gluconate 2-dehydrogenase gamma chain